MKVGKLEGKTVRVAWAAALVTMALSILPPFQLSAAAQDTLPTGLGTLKRDDIVLRMATGELEIQVLPLDEQVTRLLAPDTYRSLHDLITSRQADLDDQARRAGVGHPTLVLVGFFGTAPQARFVPEDLNLTSRGRLFRPVGMVPLSPQWGQQQLEARQQAMAIYLFDEGIGFREQLTVSYQGLTNDGWTRSARLLDQERARVLARARQTPPAPPRP
jgi:hypothetical protein